ncbi:MULTISPECIES: hypothetical protein [unclassified Endozoicomonas]|uniref:hypothetical protein n=1 Tax=unclassified Endozoicomonas TaxID=2644528 RepID=UPI00214869D1|nr:MULTISPECIES: hypothetical protein [unclassified Endozoicomonas]
MGSYKTMDALKRKKYKLQGNNFRGFHNFSLLLEQQINQSDNQFVSEQQQYLEKPLKAMTNYS